MLQSSFGHRIKRLHNGIGFCSRISDKKPCSDEEDESQHQLMPEHCQTSASEGQKQESLANDEMGFDPCSGDKVSSNVSMPPSDNPSVELASNTPVGAVNASTNVDEDQSERDAEPDESITPSESEETPMQMEERQMSEPNGESQTLSECHDITEGKNLDTPSPPATTSESVDSGPSSVSMDKNNDSSRSMKMQDENQIASSDDDSPTSSNHEKSSDGPTHHSSQSEEFFGNFGSETQYPPTQVMERPANTTSHSPYRIPSHVFASEPTAGSEWSVASNESLFSIHLGNMSFSKDMYWLGKDESDNETNMPSPRTNMFGDVSSNPTSPHMENQISLSQPAPDNESRAAETMREVISESTENLNEGTHKPAVPSHHSKGSTKSFAFPILTDVQRIGSSIIFQGKQKTEVESHPQTLEETPEEAQQLEEASNEPKQPKSATTATNNGCLSWFSCCALGETGQSS